MRRVFGLALAVVLVGVSCSRAPEPTATDPIIETAAETAVETVNEAPLETVGETLTYGQEPDQFGQLTVPAAPAVSGDLPVVVLVHGGFWQQQFTLSLMEPLAIDLAERGYAVWNVEYRRVGAGGSGGWPATGDDVGAAVDHLAALAAIYPLDLDRVVLVGHSAGGHLALWSMGRDDPTVEAVGAVLDPAFFSDARAHLGGAQADVPLAYESATPELDPDTMVLVQGGVDRVIALQTLSPAEEAGVPIVVVDNDGHFDLIDPTSKSWAAALEAITELLS